jgi:hypothetical protein
MSMAIAKIVQIIHAIILTIGSRGMLTYQLRPIYSVLQPPDDEPYPKKQSPTNLQIDMTDAA